MSQQYVLTVGNGFLTKCGYSLGVTPLYHPAATPSAHSQVPTSWGGLME